MIQKMICLVAAIAAVLLMNASLATAAPQGDSQGNGAPAYCWRLAVRCDLEPDHECCGVGSNQPSQPQPPIGVQRPPLPTGLIGKPQPPSASHSVSKREAARPQTLPARLPGGRPPQKQTRPAPAPGFQGVMTLPARLPPQ